MNTVEFAIKDGIPYAIDFTNPAPDMDVNSLTPHYFEWAVNSMADLCIGFALEGPKLDQSSYRWDTLLRGPDAPGAVASPQSNGADGSGSGSPFESYPMIRSIRSILRMSWPFGARIRKTRMG